MNTSYDVFGEIFIFKIIIKIKSEIFNSIILDFPNIPIEAGGILGGTSGAITKYILDSGKGEYGKYTPNTKMINEIIFDWAEKEIEFYGICHSHYPTGEKLSGGGVSFYIEKIWEDIKYGVN